MMGMRILLAADFYPPLIGGAERQTQLLGRNLAGRGHQVSVATVWQEKTPEEADDQGVAVHRIKATATRVPWFSTVPNRRYHPPFPDPDIVRGLRRLICDFQPDLVHSYGWMSYSCAAALTGARVPLLISAREYGYSCAVRTLMRGNRLCSGPAAVKCLRCSMRHYGALKGAAAALGVLGCRPLLQRRVDGLHSISRFVRTIMHRDLLGQVLAPKERTIALPDRIIPSFRDGVERGSVTPGLAEQLPAGPFILYVGALQGIKGLDPLLAAYRQLASPPPLVLIGTVWPDTPAEFPPGVRVLYNAPHADVMLAWERCLFGVAPSTWPEPFGVVVHEAMSKGKAIIGTVPGGHADMIVDGESGVLVPSGDVRALARAMERLIAEPQWRERLGRAALERSQLFTTEVVVPQFEELYRETVTSYCERHT